MSGLPKKYARMGFAAGWKAYRASKKTAKKKSGNKRASAPKFLSLEGQGHMSKKRKRRSCKRYAVRRYRGDGGAVEFMGADTLRRGDIGKMVSDIGVPVLGGLGGVLLGNSVPVKNPTLRAFSPLFAALVLAFIAGKSKAMRAVSLGMAVVGGANGVRALAGGRLPLLAGDPVEFAPAFPLAMSGDEIDQAVADGQITADEADVLRATSTYTGLAQDDGAAAESPFSMAGVRGGADYVLQDEI